MNELNAIHIALKGLETILYGQNYEVHLQFEIVSESTDLTKAITELRKTYKGVNLQPEKLVAIPFQEFSESVIKQFNYAGSSSHGPRFTKPKLEDFEKLNTKLWQLLKQKFIPSHTVVYRIPAIQLWIYWDFCFLIVSKDRNKVYLFEGGASD